MSGPTRVIKVGGSLFSLADLASRLQDWLAAQSTGFNILIAGGGALTDEVRHWDQRFQLGHERSHWLCVDLLDLTAQLLHHLLPASRLCRTLLDLQNGLAGGLNDIIVFAPANFLLHDEPLCSGDRLPQTWEVTSDSIAARLAEIIQADELVLLKSTLPKSHSRLADLGGDYVDQFFPTAARSLPRVRFVNLREQEFPEVCVPR